MGEFDFIAEHLVSLAGQEALDLKDDVAVWQPPPKTDAVITMDTIVEGVHFPEGKFDAGIARKLIRVNVSDLTAKGADARGYFMSLALPKWVGEDELANFCAGLARDQQEYGLKLWGGDTTRTKSACVLTATMIGTVPKGKTIHRSTAKTGDLICVTGTIGDGFLGLKTLLNQIGGKHLKGENWLASYHIPNPPFAARRAIRKHASAALDVSDGLIADAGHLALASGVGIELFLGTIPLSSETRAWLLSQPKLQEARAALASGGDDYQALMTVPSKKLPALQSACERDGVVVTVIGKTTKGEGVKCLDSLGGEIMVDKAGYTHF